MSISVNNLDMYVKYVMLDRILLYLYNNFAYIIPNLIPCPVSFLEKVKMFILDVYHGNPTILSASTLLRKDNIAININNFNN